VPNLLDLQTDWSLLYSFEFQCLTVELALEVDFKWLLFDCFIFLLLEIIVIVIIIIFGNIFQESDYLF
jgi:hypothetical protein